MNTAQQVMSFIQSYGPASRAELARRLLLSKPTTSAAIELLLRRGLLAEFGQGHGGVGRPPTLIALNAGYRHVVGIEVDAGHFQVALGDLRGDLIDSCRRAWPTGQLGAAVRSALDDPALSHGGVPLHSVALGLPGVIEAGVVRYAPNLPELEAPGALARLNAELRLPTLLFNDVNLAAVSEARRDELLAYVSIGSGFGVGVAHGQRLLSGHRGRAGELGYLPTSSGAPLEELLSERGLARLLGLQVGQLAEQLRPSDPPVLLREAARPFFDGLVQALQVLTVTLDPARIVIGGRVGARLFAQLPDLHRRLADSLPFVPELAVSAHAERAVSMGALKLAADHATRDLLGALDARRPVHA